MGGSESSHSYIGPKPETNAIFPGLDSMTATIKLENEMLSMQRQVGGFTGQAAGMTPVAGPVLSYIILILGNIDYNDVESALRKAEIDENILGNEINSFNAEIKTIRNSYDRLQRTCLTVYQQQPDIVYALRRAEYLFSLFGDSKHLFYRYPLISMPYLIKTMNILWATIQISNKLDPSLKSLNDKTLGEMSSLRKDYEKRFFDKRMKDIDYWNFDSDNIFIAYEETIRDRPWEDKWLDGVFAVHGPDGYEAYPIVREYANMKKYHNLNDYKTQLRNYYQNYFNKSFPV